MSHKSETEKRNRALVFLLYFGADTEKEQIIHSDTPGHWDEVVSVEVQMPHQKGGVKTKRGVGGKKVAREWLLKSPPPLITLCTAAAHRAA